MVPWRAVLAIQRSALHRAANLVSMGLRAPSSCSTILSCYHFLCFRVHKLFSPGLGFCLFPPSSGYWAPTWTSPIFRCFCSTLFTTGRCFRWFFSPIPYVLCLRRLVLLASPWSRLVYSCVPLSFSFPREDGSITPYMLRNANSCYPCFFKRLLPYFMPLSG